MYHTNHLSPCVFLVYISSCFPSSHYFTLSTVSSCLTHPCVSSYLRPPFVLLLYYFCKSVSSFVPFQFVFCVRVCTCASSRCSQAIEYSEFPFFGLFLTFSHFLLSHIKNKLSCWFLGLVVFILAQTLFSLNLRISVWKAIYIGKTGGGEMC